MTNDVKPDALGNVFDIVQFQRFGNLIRKTGEQDDVRCRAPVKAGD
jgi:hypothetical protein